MKTIKLLSFASAVFLVTSLFYGCTEDFEEINTNQRTLSELDAAMLGNLYARIQYRGFFINYHQTRQTLFADYYCQYTTNLQNAFPSDRYVLVGGWLNGSFQAFYSDVGGNLGVLLEQTDPVEYPENATMHALAQIYKVIVYERMTNYWGPIPYFQVNNGEASVPYDSEQAIYADFFTSLDNALSILNSNQGGNAFGDNDQIYGGDIDKWIIFANTLRLRIAMRISDVDPATAQAQAERAVADGVMEEKTDNALFQCTANSYHNMPRMLPWAEFRMSAAMESVLQGYQDPRMPLMYSATAADENVYRGALNGYSIEDLGTIPNLLPDALSDYGPRYIPVSTQDNLPYEIMWSPEAWFLRAEGVLKGWNMGGGTAEEYYNNGIEASFEYWTDWGLDIGTLAAYQQSVNVPVATWDAAEPLSTVPVLFDASDDAVALEQIHIQKWLGLWPDGWEAYADLRRSELPPMYDRKVSENPDVAADELMRRLPWVSSEYEQNAEAVAAAASLLSGPDNGATRLWWDPE